VRAFAAVAALLFLVFSFIHAMKVEATSHKIGWNRGDTPVEVVSRCIGEYIIVLNTPDQIQDKIWVRLQSACDNCVGNIDSNFSDDTILVHNRPSLFTKVGLGNGRAFPGGSSGLIGDYGRFNVCRSANKILSLGWSYVAPYWIECPSDGSRRAGDDIVANTINRPIFGGFPPKASTQLGNGKFPLSAHFSELPLHGCLLGSGRTKGPSGNN
jgi:hypothetical protein